MVCIIIYRFMVFNATFNNISVISWRSVLLVVETGVPAENHRPGANHWQNLSYNVVATFLPYKHRAMTTTYQHFSLANRELWLGHTNISLLQTQSYDYHIPTFLPYKHRAMTTTYQHFSLTNTELWLPHTNISALQTQSYDYHIPTFLPYKHRTITTTNQHFCLTNT